MNTCCKSSRILYVVLPYFNFCGFKRRRELFIKFINEIKDRKEIRIVVSEILGPEPLGKIKGPWRHIKFKTESHLWAKENLVNMAVSTLPSDWKFMAWIDADISFLNTNWASQTMDELRAEYDIVQLWRSAVNLGAYGQVLKTDQSFAYMAEGSGTAWIANDKYGFWHPGYAWACTRAAFDKMEGLIDWAILGSGDRHMAMALMGRVTQSAPGNIHSNYRKMLEDYQDRVRKLRLGWVDGTILHHWHGSMANRRYKERWEILTKGAYDPKVDICSTKEGLVMLTRKGRRMQAELDGYFLGRKEDDTQ